MKPSDWLDLVDSHGIYDVEMLSELDEQYRGAVPVHTRQETVEAIEARGLGGELDTDDVPMFYGYEAARSLAQVCTGNTPGDMYMGRGSSFRANHTALRQAGF